MKKQIIITVREVDNGFTVLVQRPGVAGSNAVKIAKTTEEAVQIGTEILTAALIQPPQGT